MTAKLIVAVEGPCCAGKTTLSRSLLHQLADLAVAYVQCYADHVGGGRNLPRPIPTSLAEDVDGLRKLIRIERDRTRTALSSTSRVILEDRGLHTLLAHRHAIEQVTGLACLTPAEALLAASDLQSWPNLVLYLDVPQEAVHDRNNGKFSAASILIDPGFNTAIRAYFAQLAGQPPPPQVVWLDATGDPAALVKTAKAQIRQLLPNHDEEDDTGC